MISLSTLFNILFNMADNCDNLVLAARFSDAATAHIAMGVLDAEGIRSVLSNENFSSLIPLAAAPFSEVSLWVSQCDLERARHIIAQAKLE